jgi:zinc protease
MKRTRHGHILVALFIVGALSFSKVGSADVAIKDDPSWRNKRPATPYGPSLHLPEVLESTSTANARVLIIERHAVPLVSVVAFVHGPHLRDPDGKSGLSSIVSQLLARGTAKHPGASFGVLLDDLGAELRVNSDADGVQIVLTVGRDELASSFDLLMEALASPELSQSALDEVRAAMIADRTSIRHGLRHAGQLVRERLYGPADPHGHSSRGTVESLNSISREDVEHFHHVAYVPESMTFVVAGDIDAATARPLLDRGLTQWARRHPSTLRDEAAPSAPDPTIQPGVVLIDDPALKQASLAVGVAIPGTDSPDWPAAQLLARTLAGVYSSRLSRTLRQDKGATYSVGATLVQRRQRSEFLIAMNVSLGETGFSVGETLQALSRLSSAPPVGEEFDRVRSTLEFDLAWSLDTTEGTALMLREIASQSLPADWLKKIQQGWTTVTTSTLRDVAGRYFDATRAVIVIEGPADVIEPQLRANGIVFRRLP